MAIFRFTKHFGVSVDRCNPVSGSLDQKFFPFFGWCLAKLREKTFCEVSVLRAHVTGWSNQ
jgi:hypothetical protein